MRYDHEVKTNVDIDHVLQAMIVAREINAAKRRAQSHTAALSGEARTPLNNPDSFRNPDAYLEHHRNVHNS
jgi:hypothetical protein